MEVEDAELFQLEAAIRSLLPPVLSSSHGHSYSRSSSNSNNSSSTALQIPEAPQAATGQEKASGKAAIQLTAVAVKGT